MSLEQKIEDLHTSVEACLIGIRHVQHENNAMKEEFKNELGHVKRRMDIQYDELSDNIRQSVTSHGLGTNPLLNPSLHSQSEQFS